MCTHAARPMAAEQPDDLADAWDKLGNWSLEKNIFMYTNMYTYTNMYISIYTCVYLHISIHMYIWTYSQISRPEACMWHVDSCGCMWVWGSVEVKVLFFVHVCADIWKCTRERSHVGSIHAESTRFVIFVCVVLVAQMKALQIHFAFNSFSFCRLITDMSREEILCVRWTPEIVSLQFSPIHLSSRYVENILTWKEPYKKGFPFFSAHNYRPIAHVSHGKLAWKAPERFATARHWSSPSYCRESHITES